MQHAVDVALPGDRIQVASGTYVEQVTISKPLDVHGAGFTTVIKAPDVKTFDAYKNTYIVRLVGGANTSMTALSVAGPGGPGGGMNCAQNVISLDTGIEVVENSTLRLSHAKVLNIYDQPASGCQRGDGISIGNQVNGDGVTYPQVGHAVIRDVAVQSYQKDGIAVRGTGSSLDLERSAVTNLPSAIIASNGVEVLDGAVGVILANRVSGNQCDLQPGTICGPDALSNTEASGILLFASDPRTVVAGNNVFANDMGIYTDDSSTIAYNSISNNRAVGIYVDTDATKAHIVSNTTNNDGRYGIAIGPLFPVSLGGTGKPNPGGNFFRNNTALRNTTTDLYQDALAGPNSNNNNHCKTAAPSTTYWDCTTDNGGPGENHQPGVAQSRPTGMSRGVSK